MENKVTKTEIFRDNQLLHTFEGEDSPNKAFVKLLQIQSNSTSWVIKWEGYKVTETTEDGTQTNWKPY